MQIRSITTAPLTTPGAIGHKGPGRPAGTTPGAGLLTKARSGQMTDYRLDIRAFKGNNPPNAVTAVILSMGKELPVYLPVPNKQAIMAKALADGSAEAFEIALAEISAPVKFERRAIGGALGVVELSREEVNDNLNKLCQRVRLALGINDTRVAPLLIAEAEEKAKADAEAKKAADAAAALEAEGVAGGASDEKKPDADDDSADDDSADDDSADDDSADDDSADDDSADDDSAEA